LESVKVIEVSWALPLLEVDHELLVGVVETIMRGVA